jgi:NAD(P)-dependent dehydrogenase (short-subunit alcohol dehydrogenase family)
MLDSGLDGHVCLVTGGASGIGLATARMLVGEGARVAICDINRETLDTADVGDDVLRVDADVSDPNQVRLMLCEVRDRLGPPLVLVHCAGIYRTTAPPDVELEEWDLVTSVNLRGAFLVCQGAMAMMRERGDGRIVLFGSFAARTGGLRASAPYAASKAGIAGLTRHLAQHGGPEGIRVNCIHPGFLETPMNAILGEEARSSAVQNTPLRRLGAPEEGAAMAVVLASDLASFVHGVELDVNGGMYMA